MAGTTDFAVVLAQAGTIASAVIVAKAAICGAAP
jgi:hypothetical protein